MSDERKPDEMGGAFDFEAGVEIKDGYYSNYYKQTLAVTYTIRLPHQCDHWVIAESTDKELAIAQAEVFIREANAALDRLREATA
jgi:hypothetical protein